LRERESGDIVNGAADLGVELKSTLHFVFDADGRIAGEWTGGEWQTA